MRSIFKDQQYFQAYIKELQSILKKQELKTEEEDLKFKRIILKYSSSSYSSIRCLLPTEVYKLDKIALVPTEELKTYIINVKMKLNSTSKAL